LKTNNNSTVRLQHLKTLFVSSA